MADLLDLSDRMAIEWHCTQLVHRFAYYLDRGAFEDVFGLFVEDGVFDRAGQVLQGHEEMRAAFRDRPKGITTRHMATNLHFTDVRHDRASALVYGISYHSNRTDESAPVPYAFSNGRFLDMHDDYVLTDAGWRFRSRVAKAVFVPSDWNL